MHILATVVTTIKNNKTKPNETKLDVKLTIQGQKAGRRMSKSASAELCRQKEVVHKKPSNYLAGLMLNSIQFSNTVLL